MAEESEEVLLKAVVWLQKKQESLKEEGFSLEFKGFDYTFYPTYIDR